jgi:hypothetical protein
MFETCVSDAYSLLPDFASFVLVSVAPPGGPYTGGMETYIEINFNSIKGAVEQN